MTTVAEKPICTSPDNPLVYPKTLDSNANYRLKLMQKCIQSDDVKRMVYSICKDEILFWVNSFAWTYNPRAENVSVPFITYGFQDEFITHVKDAIQNQEDILVEKSRDMGASWCMLAVFTWFWLFKGEGMDFLCGSRKEQYVDKIGDMATLMEKIRFILKNTPKWMLPKGFNQNEHTSYMKIINPDTKSSITGEATNSQFSRGGRQRAILFDEFAFWEVDNSAWRSSADTTNCRIAVSTPYGLSNHFARIRKSGSIKVETLHWTLHPDKARGANYKGMPLGPKEAFEQWRKTKNVTSPWYENEIARRNNDMVEIAQELDISYEGSQEGLLFEWDKMEVAKNLDIPLSLDRKVLVFDPATEGDDEAVVYVANAGCIAEKKVLAKTNSTALAAEIVQLAYKHKVQVIMGDAIGNDILGIVNTLLGLNPSRIKVVAFKSSEKAENTSRFFNRRAEAYVEASEQMRSGNLQVDDDYVLMKQLSATKYKKKNGRIILIPKEEIKPVCGSSPDRADAWALIPQAMKLTHSRREVEYNQKFRKRFSFEEAPAYSSYGDWGDTNGVWS